jgi:hypothetical protein
VFLSLFWNATIAMVGRSQPDALSDEKAVRASLSRREHDF